MSRKLKFLMVNSLKKKINTKWFRMVNLCLFILIVGILNIDHIINFFGGEFNQKQKIYVVDETKVSYDLFKDNLIELNKNFYGEKTDKYEIILSGNDKEKLVMEINDENDYYVIVISNSENIMNASII